MPLYQSIPPVDENSQIGIPVQPHPPVALPPDETVVTPPDTPVTPPPSLSVAPIGDNTVSDAGATVLPADVIGDIPPPPIPTLPNIAGGPGAGTFALPGTRGAVPFRTPAFKQTGRSPRFGPGVPTAGSSIAPGGVSDAGVGSLSPDAAAELLRRLAQGNGGA